MRDPDPLSQPLGESFDRIAPMQGAKRRRFRQWALADSADRVAPRTIGLRKGAAPINLGDLRSSARE